MTNTQIVAIVVGAVLLLIAAVCGGLCWLAPRIKTRGEVADAPCSCPWCDDLGADEACALTLPAPLEYVPNRPDPALTDCEREMAGTPAARLATRLTHWSNR